MAGTSVKTCNCDHKYQDKKYGNKKRVFNLDESGKQGKCSVCGTKKT